MKNFSIIFCVLFLFPLSNFYAQEFIDFDSGQWQVINGKTVDHLGRKSFMGSAFLKDVAFENGIIEVDIAVTGDRSYPGIKFRVQSEKDFEEFYIRPHRAGLYPDALQYSPGFNGITEWQLCNGEGYTSGRDIPENEWVRIRLEVLNDRARVFINNEETPSLNIHNLKHGVCKGGLGLNSPVNGTAYFSNFRFQETNDLKFDERPVRDLPVGMLHHWEISQVFKTDAVDLLKTPEDQGLTDDVKWEKIQAGPMGLVDVGQFRSRQGRTPDLIYARTSIIVPKDTLMEYLFGYSDAIVIFLNGKPVYFGNSAYQQRDPSFLGIIGLNDAVFLPLNKGKNELMIMVAESFGGWGFQFQQGSATYFETGISKKWETAKVFKTSESVLYDAKRGVLYVTNFDQFAMGKPDVSQFISKLDLQGEILELKWIKDLNNPLGITLKDDHLFVAERKAVAVIDLKREEIVERIPIPESLFLNDIAIADDGSIYISDSRKDVIWKVVDGKAEVWLSNPEVADPNVLYMHNNKLLIGNSGDHWLKSVDITTRKITKVACFPEGFIDGIRLDNQGNYLVSLWRGKIYRVDSEGNIKLIFHTQNIGQFTADFEYIPEKQLLIIPTFFDNKVTAYQTNW